MRDSYFNTFPIKGEAGFTLIELLIALALLVILTGALYGTYFSVTSARERGGARIEQRRELSSTLGKLHDELASSYYKKAAQTDPQKEAQASPAYHFVVEDRDSFGKPASLLQFTSLLPPRVDPAPSSDIAVTRYSVQEREEGETLSLVRESRDLYLDHSVKSQPYPVVEEIEGFLVECWDGGKWVKTWDTALTGRIPMKVKVTLTLKGGESFSTIAAQRITP